MSNVNYERPIMRRQFSTADMLLYTTILATRLALPRVVLGRQQPQIESPPAFALWYTCQRSRTPPSIR